MSKPPFPPKKKKGVSPDVKKQAKGAGLSGATARLAMGLATKGNQPC